MKRLAKPIYVEIFIRGTMEDLWRLTQTPELHTRWDLRFSRIEYLPRLALAEPQRFRYSTRLGFGLTIEGHGETVGEAIESNVERSSALKFWSEDWKSLIRSGSGYWKYHAEEGGIRFLTLYDYKVRRGRIGYAFDAAIFRPLMGWATAWSFDRLRLWIEGQIAPEIALQRWLVYALARGSVAFVWIYHGVIPKLLFPQPDEASLLEAAGLPSTSIAFVLTVIGISEVLFGGILLSAWQWRWPPFCSIALMFLAALGVTLTSPQYLVAAFNPLTLNLCVAALSAIALMTHSARPSAGRCLRRPARRT